MSQTVPGLDWLKAKTLPSGRQEAGVLTVFTFREALGSPGAVGAYPPEVDNRRLFLGEI